MLSESSWSTELRTEVGGIKEHLKSLVFEWDRPVPEYVYHYRCLDTLTKILQSKEIRLYEVMTMEDKEEFLHPLRIVRESMIPYWRELLVDVTTFFHESRQTRLTHGLSAFAACFCEASETKFMWTKYGNEGRGAAIQCRAANLRSHTKSHAFYPMMYNDAWFRKTLRLAHEYAISRRWPSRFGVEEEKVLGYHYCEQILTLVVGIKRECYRAESEWRALLLDSAGSFRSDGSRRYVGIDLLPEYVSAVVLGPRSPRSEAEMKDFLDTTPYWQAAVLRSTLPI